MYHTQYPVEILYIFERQGGRISTWILPVDDYVYHQQCCICDVQHEKPNQCVVLFNNRLYDLNIKKNRWRNHVCFYRDKTLDDLDLLEHYGSSLNVNRLSRLDLTILGERIKGVMATCDFTRLYIGGILYWNMLFTRLKEKTWRNSFFYETILPFLDALKLLEAVITSILGIRRELPRIVRSSFTISMPCLNACCKGALESPSWNTAPKIDNYKCITVI